jgi:hypothetical protein
MRARVYKQGPTWYYVVTDGEKVVNTDNTNDWGVIYHQADRVVRAFAQVQRLGHQFESWNKVVDRARR